jgi:hypothetical protein
MSRSSGSVRVLCHRGLRRLESSLSAESAAVGDVVTASVPTEVAPLDDELRLVPEVRLHG